jgi:bacillithiol system protein YtxJ
MGRHRRRREGEREERHAPEAPSLPATLNLMHADLVPLEEMDALDRLLAESADHPVLIFKHSRACGVSAEALDELREHLRQATAGTRYAIITVQTHRDLAQAVARRLGVRHETPQAILVRDGRAVWSASHWRVNTAELQRALS